MPYLHNSTNFDIRKMYWSYPPAILRRRLVSNGPRRSLVQHAQFPSDSAFVDRADIVQYIDLPPPEAIYVILRSCLLELTTKGVVAPIVRCLLILLGENIPSMTHRTFHRWKKHGTSNARRSPSTPVWHLSAQDRLQSISFGLLRNAG
jgi:hypothetical protein